MIFKFRVAAAMIRREAPVSAKFDNLTGRLKRGPPQLEDYYRDQY